MSTLFKNESTLLRFGLTEETISKYDVICLPENLEAATEASELFDANHSINFSKLLKEAGVKCANSYDLNLQAKVFERRSEDLWLGYIYVANTLIIPYIVNVLATLTTNSIDKGTNTTKQVHLKLKTKMIRKLEYDGDGETLIEILKTLK